MSNREKKLPEETADNLPEVPDADRLLAEQEEESAELMERTPPELTKRQRFWQITLGWLAGFLIWLCMAIGLMNQENELLSWLFLVVFAAAMFGRNAVERRTGMDLKLYMRSFLISLIVFLIVFVVLGPVTHVLPGG